MLAHTSHIARSTPNATDLHIREHPIVCIQLNISAPTQCSYEIEITNDSCVYVMLLVCLVFAHPKHVCENVEGFVAVSVCVVMMGVFVCGEQITHQYELHTNGTQIK